MLSSEKSNTSISAVVPAYQCEHLLAQTLAPLMALKKSGDISEVIVVDDKSTDGTRFVAESMGASVLVLPRRSGPGEARNRAALQAKSAILWFIDADVVVQPTGPERIRAAFLNEYVVAVIGSYDDRPPARNFASQYKNLVHHHYHQNGKGEISTFWAGCGAVRRDVFLQVGGFKSAVYARPCIEDIELGYRLSAFGKVMLDPRLQGTHLKSWTLFSVVRTDFFDRALPWSRLLISRGHVGNDLNVSLAERARALLALSLFAIILPAVSGTVSLGWFFGFLLAAFAVNLPLFSLCRRRNGVIFAAASLLFHQLYYAYSSVAFAWCFASAAVETALPGVAAPERLPIRAKSH